MESQQTGTGRTAQMPRGGAPGGTGTGTDMKETAKDAAQQTQEKAGELVEQAKSQVAEQATTHVESQKDRAVASLGSVAGALRQAGQHLRDNQQAPVAQIADKAADRVEQFTQQLHGKDVQELLRDVENYARRQPALFLGGAFALGLLAARFLKSSGQRESDGGGRSYGGRGYSGYGGYGGYGAFGESAAPYGSAGSAGGTASMRAGGMSTGERSWSVRGRELQ